VIRTCGLFVGLVAQASAVTMTEIARLPPAGLLELAFGDSDHDGKNEVFSLWRDAKFNFYYWICEHQGDNVYTEVYRGAHSFPRAVGDLDMDGRTDMVGQRGTVLQIFESATPNDYPTQLVWTHSSTNIIGPVAIRDTDRDGKPELIQIMQTGSYSSQLRIFESAGDNTYELLLSHATHAAQTPVIGDFDGDGLVEIAFCGESTKYPLGASEMTVVESPMDNTWVVTFSDSAGLAHDGDGAGGQDSDGNGRVELFFAGFYNEWAVVVYEAVADNVFERVAFFGFNDNSIGNGRCDFGNLDGQGPGEFVYEGNLPIRIMRPTAVGVWSLVGQLIDPNGQGLHSTPHLFDVNGNGLPELFWPSDASDAESTLVFEYDPVAAATPEPDWPASASNVVIVPSPTRSVVKLYMPGLMERIAAISVYDVAGRLVERAIPQRDAGHGLTWTPQRLATGVYWIRPETRLGEPLATRRVVFIR
jgi:hypothetical protein